MPLTDVLDAVAEAVGEAPALGTARLVVLPPLATTVAVLGEAALTHGLFGAVRRHRRVRLWRRAAVRFAYPGADSATRPWMVAQDALYWALRHGAARLAARTGATVVPGTLLSPHPRKHWESWADRADLYHWAYAIDPTGEPTDKRRQGVVDWPSMEGLRVGWGEVRRTSRLRTRVGTLDVIWDAPDWPLGAPAADSGAPPPGCGRVVWLPRIWSADRPEPHARLDVAAAVTRGAESGPVVLARSTLAGRLGARQLLGGTTLAIVRADGIVRVVSPTRVGGVPGLSLHHLTVPRAAAAARARTGPK